MKRGRTFLTLVVLALLSGWLAGNYDRLTADQHGGVRFTLAVLFALAVFLRPKLAGAEPVTASAPGRRPTVLSAAGLLLAVTGLLVPIHQFEWIGILLCMYAALVWILPWAWHRDLLLALVLIYWAHPLPGQAFALLQHGMQRWSVLGAEWLLHVLNVRVWADGLLLYSGYHVVGVPESCSGMRTGIAVLLTALGVGILLRMRVFEIILLAAAGILQVVVLNVIRIAITVMAAPKMDPAWADRFLHDTLGMLLLLAILATGIEAQVWTLVRRRRERRGASFSRAEVERPEKATRIPMFWTVLFRRTRLVLVLSLLGSVVIYAGLKSRASHRAAMREDVIDALMTSNREAAERAIEEALKRGPGRSDLLARKARLLVLRGQFVEGLAIFGELPVLSPLEAALKSWCLMATGRQDEAAVLLDALSEADRRLPGIAIIRAEFAAVRGEPQVAARYIVFAAGPLIDIHRVRALYPFLAKHEQWAAIVESDRDVPYAEVGHALIAAEAGLRVNDLAAAGRVLAQALRQWPDDIRFLRSLFVLASRRPGTEWEQRFAESLQRNIERLGTGDLSLYLGFCFRLNRPDLGWQAYLRLVLLDPRHPDVFYLPAQYGGQWFAFRRQDIGVSARDRMATIELKPLMAQTRNLWPMKYLWERIPLMTDLMGPSVVTARERYIRLCLEELQSREKNGTLTERGELIYPAVLALEGRFAEAHSRLDVIAEKYPAFISEAQLQHAEFYDREARWLDSYEAMIRYYELTDFVELRGDLLMVNALLNLNMGVAALDRVRRSQETFPSVMITEVVEAAIWDVFGFKDQALFMLREHESDIALRIMSRLMEETGRLREAERLNAVMGQRTDLDAVKRRQALFPDPAERVLAPRWPDPRTPEAMRAEADALAGPLGSASATSFPRKLNQMTVDWLRSGGSPEMSNPEAWTALARNSTERAVALHRLTVLTARQRGYAEARRTVRMALEVLPRSAVLHRIRIALSGTDESVIADALAACPSDPEIWLAHFVVRAKGKDGLKWAEKEMARVLKANFLPVETLVRAGDLMMRMGGLKPATAVADHAIREGRGYLPAYGLGLRCAFRSRDPEAALVYARGGVDNAVDPLVFYEAIVQIKRLMKKRDGDYLSALEYLNSRRTNQVAIAEQLGSAYFQQGDTRRALSVLQPAIAENLQGLRVRSLVLAAEAARVEGERETAVRLLQTALVMYPDELSVLNNLIYNLALDPKLLPQATALLPRLIELGSDNFVVLDTIAMVYLRSGQVEQARRYMDRAVALLDEENYAALETRLNAAELLYVMGRYDEARDQIMELRRNPRTAGLVDIRARRLLDEIARRRQEP